MTETSNVVTFRGIGMYLEELTVYAAMHMFGSLRIEADEGTWFASMEDDSFDTFAQGHGDTMNAAVLDLYRKLRTISS